MQKTKKRKRQLYLFVLGFLCRLQPGDNFLSFLMIWTIHLFYFEPSLATRGSSMLDQAFFSIFGLPAIFLRA
uniref:Uncharacterized protein n=1 Tax=Meloidogyne enterolobii TaxID=390850 RepID=A0A6V7UU60_MELEN|nr:unnamed protein product [Meloidogyne enterolobii]